MKKVKLSTEKSVKPPKKLGEIVRQLEYKCNWYGRTFVKIDRWFPSSKRCGYTVDMLPLNIREWDCPKCSTHHDRDVNAANNRPHPIALRGLRKNKMPEKIDINFLFSMCIG